MPKGCSCVPQDKRLRKAFGRGVLSVPNDPHNVAPLEQVLIDRRATDPPMLTSQQMQKEDIYSYLFDIKSKNPSIATSNPKREMVMKQLCPKQEMETEKRS